MSSNDGTALIRDEPPKSTSELDDSLKTKKNNSSNSNLLNIQSVVLEQLLNDPGMKEVVVMEVRYTYIYI